MPVTVQQLLKMSQDELDALYTSSPAGDIPDGDCEGTVIIAPGTVIAPVKAKLMHLFGWQGKVFDAKEGRLVNKILPTGHHAIAAEVYKGESWYDGKECIVIDYSKTSLVAEYIRDEIRLIAADVSGHSVSGQDKDHRLRTRVPNVTWHAALMGHVDPRCSPGLPTFV